VNTAMDDEQSDILENANEYESEDYDLGLAETFTFDTVSMLSDSEDFKENFEYISNSKFTKNSNIGESEKYLNKNFNYFLFYDNYDQELPINTKDLLYDSDINDVDIYELFENYENVKTENNSTVTVGGSFSKYKIILKILK
jgi:hypothetical protein